MSTASFVPPMDESDDVSVIEVMRDASVVTLAKDSFIRLRKADGFSFARSLGFQIVLAILPGLIFIVALAVELGEGRVQSLLRQGVTTLAPGPASDLLLQALDQGSQAGRGSGLAMVLGGMAALISAVVAMAQLQRGASRIYGVLSDRPTLKRYGLATILTLSVGLLMTMSLGLIVLGASLSGAIRSEIAQTWAWARWPIGVAALTVALAALFIVAPNRSQPHFRWLAVGGLIAVVGSIAISSGLAMFLNASTTFGETYGPLAGFMGVMLWAQAVAAILLYGLAVSAQIEGLVAGVRSPTVEPDAEAHPGDPEVRTPEMDGTG